MKYEVKGSHTLKVKIEVRESVVEIHEITMDQDTFDNIGIDDSMYDYISNDTLVHKECIDTDYQIINEGSQNVVET